MYITSECFGITRMLNIKCPLYTSIVIHDVILGTKKEPACPANTIVTPNPLLNPMCCRPSCNDCFQRADTVVQEIEEQCNGMNYCDVPPKMGMEGFCDKNQTEYMAVAYHCRISSRLSDNTSALFSIEEDLCGRSRNTGIVSKVETTTLTPSILMNSTAAPSTAAVTNMAVTTAPSTAAATNVSLTSVPPTAPATNITVTVPSTTAATNIGVIVTTSIPKPSPSSSMSTQPFPEAAVVKDVKNKTIQSTNPVKNVQTTSLHRTPTKRFVPTGRMKVSSTSTSSTRLVMANRPGPDELPSIGPLNKVKKTWNIVTQGAWIGGVAAAAGLLVFVLSLVMIRRRRRKLHPRLCTRGPIFNDLSIDHNRGGQVASPVDEIATPTSLSEEGQTPWRFGPPDLNFATIHTDAGHIPVNVHDITPLPTACYREPATIRPIYAAVDRRLSTSAGTGTTGSHLYDQIEHMSRPSFRDISPKIPERRGIPPPPPLPTSKPRNNRHSQHSCWPHKQSTAPRYSGPVFSDIVGLR